MEVWMRKILVFSVGLAVGLGVIGGGAFGFIHSKMNKEAKRIETDINRLKTTFMDQYANPIQGVSYSIDGSVKCEKEGWFKPAVVCRAGELALKVQNQDQEFHPFSIENLTLSFESSIQMLLGNEVDAKVSGNFKPNKAFINEVVDTSMSNKQEIMLAKSLISWMPNKFDISFKAVVDNEKTFMTSTTLELKSSILNYKISSKEQSEVLKENRISLFDFLKQDYFYPNSELIRYTPLFVEFTISKGSRTKEEIEQFLNQLAYSEPIFMGLSPDSVGDAINFGLGVLISECEKCPRIPNFQQYIQYVKNISSVVFAQNESTTLAFALKKDADIQSKAFEDLRKVLENPNLIGVSDADLGEIMINVLNAYDVNVK